MLTLLFQLKVFRGWLPASQQLGQPGLKAAVACVYEAYWRPLAEQVGAAMLAVKQVTLAGLWCHMECVNSQICTPYTFYTAHYTLHPIHITQCTIHPTLTTIDCTLHTIHCKLHTIHCKLPNLHNTVLHTVHYTLKTIQCTLHTLDLEQFCISLLLVE